MELKYRIILLVFGSVGVFAFALFAWFAYSFYLDSICPAQMTRCLPESVFIKPATETPEGRAFLARYPDPKFGVDQTCLEERTFPCSVDIVHNQNSSVPEGARVTLAMTVMKAYLDRYPHNTVTIMRNGTASNTPEVTFIPTTSEPIKMIVHFEGLDWNIAWTSIACSNGNQTWYLLDDDYDFWSRLQPEQGNCWDYPPPE